MDEIVSLEVEVDDPPSEAAPLSNPVPLVTHPMLCADPLPSDGSCGHSVANIPQSRPLLPHSPPKDFEALRTLHIRDGEKPRARGLCGTARLSIFAKHREEGTAGVENPTASNEERSSRQIHQSNEQSQELQKPQPHQPPPVQNKKQQQAADDMDMESVSSFG
eukprot:TRINITY_DN14631_c0_g2_i1.p1 TRINITY_DN14631_c0_g2~~TRINITY_DN14631_c0_g2_i1.p1  ORF type:complete len:172 (+),score=18.06 TRINITY_DN14631_c0_g2_i1:29-517(+)